MVEETLINLIQARMDKCTTEQFWVTGAITGMAVALISESLNGPLESYPLIVIGVQIFLAIWGVYFVIYRHWSFYNLEKKQAVLAKKVGAESYIERNGSLWRGHSLSGVGFYVLWIVIATFGVIACYCD